MFIDLLLAHEMTLTHSCDMNSLRYWYWFFSHANLSSVLNSYDTSSLNYTVVKGMFGSKNLVKELLKGLHNSVLLQLSCAVG